MMLSRHDLSDLTFVARMARIIHTETEALNDR